VVKDYLNEVLRAHPLEGRPGYPYIESSSQATYKERCSPDRVVMSLREEKLVNLACKEGHLIRASVHVRCGCRHGLVPTS
jgi:hypothetical protein